MIRVPDGRNGVLARRARQLTVTGILALIGLALTEKARSMPPVLERIARCETGLRWDWDGSSYVSAFGMYRQTYDQGRRATHTRPWGHPHPSPAEQVKVALWVARRYGYSAWGCARYHWVMYGR